MTSSLELIKFIEEGVEGTFAFRENLAQQTQFFTEHSNLQYLLEPS